MTGEPPKPKPDRMVILGENVRRLRGDRSQREVSEGAGLSSAVVNQLETVMNNDVKIETVDKLAAFFKVSREALFTPSGATTSQTTDPNAGRWRTVAKRYINFELEASAALSAYGEHVLDVASDEVGHQKSETGPSREEARAIIDRARDGIRYYEGRAAEARDIGLEAARAVSPKPKRPRGKR